MDFTIRSVAEACRVSGEAFTPGARVRSCLYRNAGGVIERADVLEDQRQQLGIDPATVICSWVHRIREKQMSDAEEKRASLQSAEEVFLSLYEESADDGDAMTIDTRDRLKFFLALQLERKRILKPLGGRRYRHVASKRELIVPDLEISADLLAEFQQELAWIFGGEGPGGSVVR